MKQYEFERQLLTETQADRVDIDVVRDITGEHMNVAIYKEDKKYDMVIHITRDKLKTTQALLDEIIMRLNWRIKGMIA